jgi:desulfoferrodoxin (superoxide reductase-like protein)
VERRLFLASLAALPATAVGAATPALAQEACRPEQDAAGREVTASSTGLDRTHLPFVSLPARPRLGRPFDLVVRVGEPQHEQRTEHHVQWIDVRYGDERLFACDLSPSVPFPVVRVPVLLRRADELVVRLRCSQHGVHAWRLALAPR